jgi:hypothetical protein
VIGDRIGRLVLRDAVRGSYAIVAIAAAAVALRVVGLAYGLPAVYNPDETPILNRALAIAQDPKPQNFVYPSLYFYLLFVWEGLYFVGARLLGSFSSLADFQTAFFTDPSGHFLAGRVFSVVCGTLTVVAVYLLAARLYDRPTGLIAAAAMAVSPIAVRDAHYVKLDIPTTMFVAFAHVALARLVVDASAANRTRPWVLAGFLSGLAVSTQYYAIFLAFTMIAVAGVDAHRRGGVRTTLSLFAWSVVGAVAGFFVGSPFIPFNLTQAISDVAHVREVDIDRAMVDGQFTAVLPYLRILLWDAMGWPIWIAAVIGFVWAIVVDWRRGLLLVSFFVPFALFIANTVPMSRYLNVALPLIAVAAGFAIGRLQQRLGKPLLAVPVVALMLTPGLIESLKWDFFLRQADTRTLAGAFIRSTIAPGRSLLVQPYGPPLRQSREALVEALRTHLGSEDRASTKFQLMLRLDPYPAPSYRLVYLGEGGLDVDKLYIGPEAFTGDAGLAPLRHTAIDYVVLKRSISPDPTIAGLDSALARDARRIARFTPYRETATEAERAETPPFLHNTAAVIRPALERPGPIVEIWDVRAER